MAVATGNSKSNLPLKYVTDIPNPRIANTGGGHIDLENPTYHVNEYVYLDSKQ